MRLDASLTAGRAAILVARFPATFFAAGFAVLFDLDVLLGIIRPPWVQMVVLKRRSVGGG
jgi:hypothetical protein